MKNEDIKFFFNRISKIRLSNFEKKRMLKLLQIRGSNKKNKVMNYTDFKSYIKNKNGNITKVVLGPNWNRLVFIDIDVEV